MIRTALNLLPALAATASILLSAPSASAATLDGSKWTLKVKGLTGFLMGKDAVSFDGGIVTSEKCIPYGFKPGPYQATATGWTAHCANAKGETMDWTGTVEGDVMTGSYVYTKANGKKQTASWKATREASAATPKTAALPVDRDRVVTHLKNHVDYPANRKTILAACAETEEFSASQKEWFAGRLPEGTYASAEDVLKAAGL